jgi:hypothetical protein
MLMIGYHRVQRAAPTTQPRPSNVPLPTHLRYCASDEILCPWSPNSTWTPTPAGNAPP